MSDARTEWSEALTARPGSKAWDRILRQFETLVDLGAELDPLLQAAAEALATWPDRYRVVDAARWYRSDREKLPWPLIRTLDLSNPRRARAAVVDDLGELTDLGQLTALALRGHELGADELRTLLELPQTQGLVSLDLSNCGLDVAALTQVASAATRTLRTLDLRDNGLTAASLEALAASSPPAITSLQLNGNALTGAGAELARLVGGLEHLTAARCALGPEDVNAVVDALDRTRVSRIDLSENPCGDAIGAAMAGSPWKELKRLSLRDCGLGAPFVAVLSAQTPALQRLYLDGNELGDPACEALSKAAVTLQKLSLRRCGVTGRGLAPLALAGPRMADLQVLDLSENPLGNGAGAPLTAGLVAAPLEWLGLADCQLGPDALRGLLSAPVAGKLRELDLSGNPLGRADVLAQIPPLRRLRKLKLDRTGLGDDGVAALVRGGLLEFVQELHLSGAGLSGRGAGHLKAARALRRLTLADNAIGDAGLNQLLRRDRLGRLQFLDLARNPIGPSGIRAVARRGMHKCIDSIVRGRIEDMRALAVGRDLKTLAAERGPWTLPLNEAVVAVLQAYGEPITGFLYNQLRSEERVDEVFSQFSLDLVRGLPRFAFECTVRTWSFTLARNALYRHLKDPNRRPEYHVNLESVSRISILAKQLSSSTLTIFRTRIRDHVAQMRAQLEDDDRLLLELYIDQEMPWNDVAQVFLGETQDLSSDHTEVLKEANRLRQRYHRLRRKMKRSILAEGLLDSST
jgi:RNA polymerase sigma-70 factor, ECF subfamily